MFFLNVFDPLVDRLTTAIETGSTGNFAIESSVISAVSIIGATAILML